MRRAKAAGFFDKNQKVQQAMVEKTAEEQNKKYNEAIA